MTGFESQFAHLGTGADIAEFSFDKNGRIDGSECVYCLFGSADILLERQR